MKRLSFLSSELFLGALVAILSVLVALAAYQGSLADSMEGDLNVAGQKQLTDSNAFYLEANQFVIYDYNMYDGWYINEGVNEENAEYYLNSFSEALSASMQRESGPFDDQYYEEMFADANTTYDDALISFENAQKAGDRADSLQLVVLIYAVGLALSAYGSLLDNESILRKLFSIGSVVALIFAATVHINTLMG